MSAGADRAGARLNAMQDSFSGKKIIQDATLISAAVERAGGASKLTASEMARVNSTVTEAIAKYAALGQQAPKSLTDLAEATKRVEAPTEGLSTKMVALGSFIGTMAANAVAALGRLAMDGLSKVAGVIGELVMSGAKLSGIDNSFQTLARSVGEVGAVMLGAMRTGTRGLVADMDLMQAANKAILLGLPVTAKEMGDLSQTATVLGRAMGLTATQAFNDLVTALGRSSPLILDNLGLSVKVGEANEVMAAKLGKTVTQLTDAETKTAFYNAAMEAARAKVAELGESHLTLGDNIQKAGVWWDNFKNDLAIAIARSPVLGAGMASLGASIAAAFGTDSAGRVRTLTDLVNKFAIWVVDAGIYLIEFGRIGVQVFNALAVPQKAVAAAFVYLVERFASGIAVMSDLASRLPGVGGAFDGVAASARRAADTWAGFRTSTSGALSASVDLARGQGAVHGALDKTTAALVTAKAAMIAAGNTIVQTTTSQARATVATVADTTATKAQTTARLESEKAAAKFAGTVKNLYTSDLYEPFKRGVEEASQALEELPASAKIAENGLTQFKAVVIATGSATDSLGTKIRDGLSGVLTTIPGTLARAFEGGGNLLGAVQSIGSQIGSALGNTIGKTFQSLGSLGGPIGSALGSLVGPLIGKIAGLFTDQNKIQVQKYNAEIEKLRAGLLTTHGTLDALEAAGQRVGISFKENWGHQGQKGLEQMNALMQQFEQRTKAVDAALGQVGGGFGAVVTGMTKPWIELGKAGEGAKQQLADLGVQAVATFGAAMVAGKSYAEAIALMGPSTATLGEAFKALGLNVEDVGLKHLILQSTVAKGNPELIAAASGLGASMQGLAQLGMLNVETFDAMQRTGAAMYARLQGEVGALGGNSRDALLPMQDFLQQAAIQAKLLGIPLDANTQMLIEQSKELGLWKEQGVSAQDKLIEGMQMMVEKVDQLLSSMLGFSGAITNLPARRDIEINVTTNERVLRTVSDVVDMGGNQVDWGGVQARGGDYFVTKPTLFLAGEAGPERATFGGANNSGADSDLLDRIEHTMRDLPRAIKVAFSDALVQAR